MTKIAIIYTTFMRPELAAETIESLREHSPTGSFIMIGDQSDVRDRDMLRLSRPRIRKAYASRDHYYVLPYDCGLSYARNYLVSEARRLGYDYCLVTADSIDFRESYNLEAIVSFLGASPDRILCGLGLRGRVAWEFDIKLIPGQHFRLVLPPDETLRERGVTFRRVGICRNLFVAKTDLLLKVPWDEGLKLCEHEDWFYRVRSAGLKCYYTDQVSGVYVNDKPDAYNVMRKRMYTTFRDKLLQKYGITEPFVYSPEVVKKLQEAANVR